MYTIYPHNPTQECIMETQPVTLTEAGDSPSQIVEVINDTTDKILENIYNFFDGFNEYADDEQEVPRFI